MNIYVDSKMNDDARRGEIYRGGVLRPFAFSERARTLPIGAEHDRRSLPPLRSPDDPRASAGREMRGDSRHLETAIHSSSAAKECIRGMLAITGHDLSQTYFDVPRMRTAFPGDYLKSGIAYAFHPHRDTWYSAPFCQINWWMPVYELNSENCMAMHPHYFERAIKNGSRDVQLPQVELGKPAQRGAAR